VERVADVEELFLPMQLEFVQGLRPVLPAEAVELLAVDPDDITQIAVPAEDSAKYIVELGELHVIGYGNQPDHHGAHLTENGAQHQALAEMLNRHLHSLAPHLPPTFGRTPRPAPDLCEIVPQSGRGFGANSAAARPRLHPDHRTLSWHQARSRPGRQ